MAAGWASRPEGPDYHCPNTWHVFHRCSLPLACTAPNGNMPSSGGAARAHARARSDGQPWRRGGAAHVHGGSWGHVCGGGVVVAVRSPWRNGRQLHPWIEGTAVKRHLSLFLRLRKAPAHRLAARHPVAGTQGSTLCRGPRPRVSGGLSRARSRPACTTPALVPHGSPCTTTPPLLQLNKDGARPALQGPRLHFDDGPRRCPMMPHPIPLASRPQALSGRRCHCSLPYAIVPARRGARGREGGKAELTYPGLCTPPPCSLLVSAAFVCPGLSSSISGKRLAQRQMPLAQRQSAKASAPPVPRHPLPPPPESVAPPPRSSPASTKTPDPLVLVPLVLRRW